LLAFPLLPQSPQSRILETPGGSPEKILCLQAQQSMLGQVEESTQAEIGSLEEDEGHSPEKVLDMEAQDACSSTSSHSETQSVHEEQKVQSQVRSAYAGSLRQVQEVASGQAPSPEEQGVAKEVVQAPQLATREDGEAEVEEETRVLEEQVLQSQAPRAPCCSEEVCQDAESILPQENAGTCALLAQARLSPLSSEKVSR